MSAEKPTYVEHPQYDGYLIGTDGSVWSRWRHGRGACKGPTAKPRRLRPYVGADGYARVTLRVAAYERAYVTVHRLVLETLGPPRPPGTECRHLNGRRTDNRLVNLAWGTSKQNQADRIAHGTDIRGEQSPTAVLDAWAVLEMRQMRREGETYRHILATMRAFGYDVSLTAALRAVTGLTWAHLPDPVPRTAGTPRPTRRKCDPMLAW